MRPDVAEIRRWLTKARHDWSVSGKILSTDGPEYDVAAFHCQQAVEKILKAYLVSQNLTFERVHDLGHLLDHCVAENAAFELLRDDVEPLTVYAVTFRYPGPADPVRKDVDSALQVVQRVWDFAIRHLPSQAMPE